ncbi:SDR family oxidoreductase [Kordiimonas sp. SCSIO 12610]|nr:SDR family oxidoreductase [Kordiimonas sp. SCSIO 12610]
MNLSNETILVTGASRGIGASAAEVLLAHGANVIGTFNQSAGLLSDLQTRYGTDRVLAVKADLGQTVAVQQMWEEALAFKGQITGIVNNAGIMPETPISVDDDTWHKDWNDVLQVNVQAVADISRLAILHFQETKNKGRIVNVASRAAFRGDGPDFMHYAASKSAVVGLTRTIARAYAREGIYAFIIAPGWVKTDMAAIAYEPGNEWMLDEVPMGRAAEPEEIANMIAFLLAGMSDSSTGATFDINGASYVR